MGASRRTTTIDEVVKRLAPDFPDFSEQKVRAVATQEYDSLLATRIHIRLYVPNLVEHATRRRLSGLPATPPHTP